MTAALLLIAGMVLLVLGAELLVRGASTLAAALGISPLIIGLTVVAYGTSAPELAVSTTAALNGRADIALGNVVGSNIFNVLFILGVSAAVMPLRVSRQLIRSDVPLMILASFALLLLALDGKIGRTDGILLFAGAITYTAALVLLARRQNGAAGNGGKTERARVPWFSSLAFVIGGLGLLVLGATWLVESATTIARYMGVSELVIGLTIVAGGTSLPELATSVLASIRGEREIAVGNIVGSNLFNILAILGLSSIVSDINVAPAALRFDIPIMVAVAVSCLPVFFTGATIGRWEALMFLGFYAAYVLYLFLASTGHDALPAFSHVMLIYVVPLVALALFASAWKYARQQRLAKEQN